MPNLPRLHLRVAYICALVCALVLVCNCAVAQTGFASISGRVADHSGAVIQKADVTIKNLDTGVVLASQTNNDGIYTFPSVKPGNYVMHVQKQGFRSVDVTGLTMYTQDQLARNFALDVGSISESVTVQADTTNESPAVSLTVTREFIENMPLNGRSFQDLIQLAPGAVSDQNGYYSVDGQRTDSNNFMVDGVSANLGGLNNQPGGNFGSGLSGSAPSQTSLGTTQSLASVDSLQEFKIQTSGYSAEYGRSPGGQFEFTTRSGTNNLHGALFEYFRNEALDANSYQNDFYDFSKTPERQNDFGGTIGGPLIVPRLYKGIDKTFFFFSYEGLRLKLPAFESEYVPTIAFRNWASPYVRPFLDSAPLPNPNSPSNQDSCTIPDPSTGQQTACDALFAYGYSNPSSLDNISVRLDETFSQRYHGFIRYADTPSSSTSGAENPGSSLTNIHAWTAGATATITQKLLSDFRFNYSRDGEQSTYSQIPVGGSQPWSRDLLIPRSYDGPSASTDSEIYVQGTSLFSQSIYSGRSTIQQQYQIVDTVSWTRGTHGIKFGVDWRRLAPIAAVFGYSSYFSVGSLADIQDGVATYLQTGQGRPGRPVFHQLSLYAQDHWRITPRLTIDYGVRWDFDPPPGPSNGLYPLALTSNMLATANLSTASVQPYQTRYDNLAPRLGFEWNILPSRKHAITMRGGFGVFFDTGQQVIGQAYLRAFPFSAPSNTLMGLPLPLTLTELTPSPFSTSLEPPYPYINELVSPTLTAPYTEHWNLSTDLELATHNTLTASYVGNVGRRLLFSQYYGSAPQGNQQFPNGLQFTNNQSHSSYDALQIQDLGRLGPGLDLVASFTYAHALDDASTDYQSNSQPAWGNADNDLRRALNLALNYKLSNGGPNGWIREMTRGWLLANRFSAQSGYPLDILESSTFLPDGTAVNYRPDLVRGVPIYLHGRAADVNGMPIPGSWRLNAGAFSPVPVDSNGNQIRPGSLGRNYVRNPSFYSLNTSVQRIFPFRDRLRVDFRVDAFNILNHPNLDNPDTYLPDTTFGELIYGNTTKIGSSNALYSMGSARSLQLSLRLEF